MSYTIEYNRQFLKHEEDGTTYYTPVWLCGDNNVTEFRFGHERRARRWSCFCGKIGATKEELMELAESMTGGSYEEHWKKNSKWIDDKGLINWMKSGIRSAATLEDVLTYNGLHSVECYVSVWNALDNDTKLTVYCRSNDEFSAWIREAKALIAREEKSGNRGYPCISFSKEDLIHPRPDSKSTGPFILKYGKSYLKEYTESGSTWVYDPKEATVYTKEQVMEIKSISGRRGRLAQARAISANIKERPYNYVLMFIDGYRKGYYIQNRTNRRVYMTSIIKDAKHYPDKKAAESAMIRIQPAFAHVGTIEAVLDDAIKV